MAKSEPKPPLKNRPYEDEKPAFYFAYPIVPLILLLLSILIVSIVPAEQRVAAMWGVAFAGAALLASINLLALVFIWLKSRTAGRIVAALSVVGWLAWLFLATLSGQTRMPPNSFLVTLFGVPLIAFLILALGLYLLSTFALPLDIRGNLWTKWRDRKCRQVFRFLIGYGIKMNYPGYVVTREPSEEDQIVQRVKGDPFAMVAVGPGFVMSDCDHAVAISDGVDFKGVQGPGVTFTGFADQPVQAVDLRPQLRTHTVRGLTQDGIEVKVLFFAPFQIDRGGQEVKLGQPFPYRRGAAFKAVHAQKMEHSESGEEPVKQCHWDDLPVLIGTRVMQDVLSRYRFDELYGPYETGEPPRVRIAKEFLDQLKKELQPLGITVVGGGISNLLPANDEVLKQRVRSWQADWARQVMLKQAESRAEWLLRIERARAEAQTDLILALGRALADLERPGVEITPEKIVPHFLRILEDLASRPMMRRFLPQSTSDDMRRMRESFEP